MHKIIIIIVIIIIISLICSNIFTTPEHLTNTTNEAVQNLSSVYNAKSIQVNDINATNINSTIVTGTSVNGAMNATGCDLILGKTSCDRGDCGNCRALVKDNSNTLVLNYGNDFKGGIRADSRITVTGRDILKELDSLQDQINSIKNNYVPFNRNVSSKPINDFGRCFDFGSDGRTGCDNGWSIVQIIPR